MSNVASNGLYWSRTPNGNGGYSLNFNSGGVSPSNTNDRCYGFAVRCLPE